MKRTLALVVLLALAIAGVAYGTTITDDMVFEGPVTFTGGIAQSGTNMTVTPAASGYLNILVGNLKVGNGTPGTSLNGEDAYIEGTLEVDGVAQFDATTIKLRALTYTLPSAHGAGYFYNNGTGTISFSAGVGNTLDEAYDQGGAGTGRTINATDGAVVIQNTDADTTNILELNKSPSAGAAGSAIAITMGANATGAGIAFTNGGSGNDVTGTGGTWSVNKAGLGTFVGVTSTGTVTLTGATIAGASPLVFDGNTADVNKTTIAVTDPTAARTITIPNASGTVRVLATASHDYGAAHADWTLSVAEQAASYITATNADAGANVLLSAAIPGACWFVYNASGQILTFKVTGQTGGTIASTKRAYYCSDAVDVYEIWEQS